MKSYQPQFALDVFQTVEFSYTKPQTDTTKDQQDEIIKEIFLQKELIELIRSWNHFKVLVCTQLFLYKAVRSFTSSSKEQIHLQVQ